MGNRYKSDRLMKGRERARQVSRTIGRVRGAETEGVREGALGRGGKEEGVERIQ